MKQLYLTSYIQEQKIKDPVLADALRFELDRRIYHYGNHFLDSTEKCEKVLSRAFLRNLAYKCKIQSDNWRGKKITSESIVSSAYVSADTRISSKNIQLLTPPWAPKLDQSNFFKVNLYKDCSKLFDQIAKANFNDLLVESFFEQYKILKIDLHKFYSDSHIKAGLFANDLGFFEVLSLSILKDLKKKSFLYIHGLPGHYSKTMYSKSDYLMVWGDAVKKHFIQAGMSAEKIKVVGHPKFKPTGLSVKSSLDNVLVLGSSVPGAQLDEEQVLLWDRGNAILHCYMIQEALLTAGVKKALLRPHPSESREWYKKFIDLNFYEFDESLNFESATKSSSLVIGPTSTSAIEALSMGVNYIVFEPFYGKGSYLHYKLVPPFDKSDSRLLVANNVSELAQYLKNGTMSDAGIVRDYFSENYTLEEAISELI